MEDGTTSHGLGLKLMECGEIDALCSLYKHFVMWQLLVLFLPFLFFSMLGCAAFLAPACTLGEALMAEFSLQEFFSLKASESQIGQLIIIYICLLYQKVLVKSTRKGTCFNWEITINFSYTNLVNLLRKIFVNGKKDNSVEGGSSYDGMSGKTQIGTWWSGNNGLKTNVEIDNLYIIDKAIQYSPTDQQLCYARAINLNTP